jgi:cytochrome c
MRKTITIAALACLSLSTGALAQKKGPEAALAKANCLACHTKDKMLVGPAYKTVAAKYKGQDDAVAKLMDKVRNGGSGVYGVAAMPPNPSDKISDADLKAAIEWILKQ